MWFVGQFNIYVIDYSRIENVKLFSFIDLWFLEQWFFAIFLIDIHMQNRLWFVTGDDLGERDQKIHKFFHNLKISML